MRMPVSLNASRWLLLTTIGLLGACAGSRQKSESTTLIDAADMAYIGSAAFERWQSRSQLSADYAALSEARCVADHLVSALPEDFPVWTWQTVVVANQQAQAYALPGGHIGISIGMRQAAGEPGQLAEVISHELGHLINRHASVRVSAAFTFEAAIAAVQSFRGNQGPPASKSLYALLGLGAEVGVLVPYTRAQETEADASAALLLAQAGFDPTTSPSLWARLRTNGQATAAQWLSTHPDPGPRAETVQAQAIQLYQSVPQVDLKGLCQDS
jgi:predicted Zn-dependent protease